MYKTRNSWLRSGDFCVNVDGINFLPKGIAYEEAIEQLWNDTLISSFINYNKSNRLILMDYDGKKTDDKKFINSLRGINSSSNMSIEYCNFQKEFHPDGCVWRRLPVFLNWHQ